MFLKLFKSGENKFRAIVIATIVISSLALLFYADFVNKKRSQKELEQQLFQVGKSYEYEIKSKIDKYYAIAEVLSNSFSKTANNKDFIKNSESVIISLMQKHNRVAGFTLNIEPNEKYSKIKKAISTDSVSTKQIKYTRDKNNAVKESFNSEQTDPLLQAEIEISISKEETKVLSPIIKYVNDKNLPVIPIISPIYKGKSYIGYIVMLVSVNWLDTNKQFTSNYEAYVANNRGRLVAIKKDEVFLSENLKKVCFSCKGLLNEKGAEFNSSYRDGLLTLCFKTQLGENQKKWNICLRSQQSSLSDFIETRLFLWVWGIFIIAVAIATIIFQNKKLDRPWDSLQKATEHILEGSIDSNEFTLTGTNPQLKKIERSLTILSNSLKELSNINQSVHSGDFTKAFEIPEFKHNLVRSTKNLYSQLKSTRGKLAESTIEAKQAKEFNEGLDKIAGVLKLHHRNLQELSEQVVRTLVDLMDIAMGAIFMTQEKDGQEEKTLELLVSYAYHENKFHKRSFKFGESLVGACAAEKRTVLLKKVPEDYLKIISGLGETPPKSLLIIPLVFEDEVLGVVELGTLRDFDNNQINFAESASQNIASTLSLAKTNIVTSKLLEKNKEQTKELEERDRKMKEALAELKTLQGKTAKSEAAVRAKIEAMNNTLMMVEYTTEGVLLDANFKFLNTMNYTLDEIKGNNVIELLKEEDREELIKVMNTVKSGNFYESLMRRHTKLGHEKWFLASYTPVFNDEGIVQNILFFGVDITRMQNKQIQLKEELERLKPGTQKKGTNPEG